MTDHRYDDERGEWNERDDDYGERLRQRERSAQRYFGHPERGRELNRPEEVQRWEAEGGRPSPRRRGGYSELGGNRDLERDWRDIEQQRYLGGERDDRGYGGQRERFGGFGGNERQEQYGNPVRFGHYRGGQYGSSPYRGGQYGGGQYSGNQYFDESYGGAGRGRWSGLGNDDSERDAARRWDFAEFDRGRGSRQQSSGGEYGGRTDQERERQWGASSGQRFGQPPKGYKRSDERIREDVCDALMRRPDVDASEIEVQVRDGEVTLQGSVANRSAKFEIEHLADAIPGVKDVTNSLRIKRQETQRGSSASSSSSASTGSSSGGSGSADESRIGGGARSPNTAHSPRG